MLKATDLLDSPVTWRASHISGIPVWASVFGPKLQLLPFQKGAFWDGNAVKDLICRYCPALSTHINTFDFKDSNSSEFAEVTVILQKYFAVNYPCQPRAFRNDANFLLAALAHIAKTLAIRTPPRLHDDVAQVILSNHADQIRILRDDYGLTFEHLNEYQQDAAKAVTVFSFTGQFGDICRFDTKVVDTLFCAALKQLAHRDADL